MLKLFSLQKTKKMRFQNKLLIIIFAKSFLKSSLIEYKILLFPKKTIKQNLQSWCAVIELQII